MATRLVVLFMRTNSLCFTLSLQIPRRAFRLSRCKHKFSRLLSQPVLINPASRLNLFISISLFAPSPQLSKHPCGKFLQFRSHIPASFSISLISMLSIKILVILSMFESISSSYETFRSIGPIRYRKNSTFSRIP